MSELDPLPPRYPAPPVNLKPISSWKWIASIAGVLALCAAIVFVYKSFKGVMRQADPLIAGLHAKMVRGDDAGIFADSDPSYRQRVGEGKSDAIFKKIHDQLGAPRTATCFSQQMPSDTQLGTVLILSCSTTFDRGIGSEAMMMRKSDSGYRMMTYSLQSSVLSVTSD
jgi:hypothetical protein